MRRIMKYGRDRNRMESITTKAAHNLVWAVLSRPVNGHSEVIKITNHEEADREVQEHPTLYYKSGPIVLS